MSRYAQLRWAEVKVGLLVLVALTMLVVMIMSLEKGVGLPGSQYQVRAVVPHTQSLKVGAPVRMNGVDVGNVRQISIGQDTPKVEITFSVNRDVAAHIRNDATVSIRPMGLLGDKFLEILPGTPSRPPLAVGSCWSVRQRPISAGSRPGPAPRSRTSTTPSERSSIFSRASAR